MLTKVKFLEALLACSLLIASVSIVLAETPETKLVSIDSLLRSDRDTGFTISPDGRYLAFAQNLPRQYLLAFTDLNDLKVVQHIPLGSDYPSNLRWISKRRVVFEIRGAIVTANVDGSETRVILPNIYDPKSKSISFSRAMRIFKNWVFMHALPENREEILVSGVDTKGIASVHRLNVFTGELTDVVEGKKNRISKWWVDQRGKVRLGQSARKGQVDFYVRDPISGKVSLMTSVEGGSSLSYNGRSYVNQRVFVGGFTYDNDAIFLAENIGKDRFRLVRYRLSEQRIVDTIIEDSRYDLGSLDTGTRLHFLDAEKKLVGVSYGRDRYHTEWFDDRFIAFQAFLDERYSDGVSLIIDWTADLKKLLVLTWSDKSPGKVVIYLTEEDKLALHSEFSPEILDYDMGDMQVVEINARDGYELEGYLTMPPKHDGQALPAIVIPHGGPWARDFWGFDPDAQFFATRGFAVLQVNFRGSTGYGREHLLSGVRKISTLMLDDIADGANWLVASGHARPEEMFILGTSYGGYAALMSSIRYPKLYSAVISLSAPLDIVTQINDYKKDDNYFSYEYWKSAVGNPRSQKKLLKEISPINRIDELTVPFIIFHGEKDPVVSVDQVRRFEKELEKSNIDGSVNIIRGEGHGLRVNSNRIYFLESALDHFEKHIQDD